MNTQQVALGARTDPRWLATAMRPMLPELTSEIALEIQSQVTDYGPHSSSAYLVSARLAIAQAVHYFVDQLADPAAPRTELDETLRRIGRGEAYEGRTLEALRSSFAIGAGLGARQVQFLAVRQGLPPHIRDALDAQLTGFMESLAQQAAIGYREAQTQLSDAAYEWRARVLDLVLAGPGAPPGELAARADAGNWSVPRTVCLVAVRRSAGVALPSARMLHPRGLAKLNADEPVLLYPAPLGGEAREELAGLFDGHRLALGCPVPIADAASSLRWARRALELAAQGLIPDAAVIDCAEHIGNLWVHAEPLLADIVCRTVLAPLFDEPPNSRRILGETLLAWIETTRGSAPMLAEILGRHPQTIRYRLKRLRTLLGSALEDPERVIEMHFALRSNGPSWNDGQPAPRPYLHLTREPAGV